jgi:hypothetical protein
MMAQMLRVEQLVNDYIKCWIPNRPAYSGLFESNDFGCEYLQIFRNGFTLFDFNHDELSQLASLLTRELRGQINNDHYLFWGWCGFLTTYFEKDVSLFGDRDWHGGYTDLLNLILSKRRRSPAGPAFINWSIQALQYVNSHLLETESNKWNVSGPLAFSILEGLLRRKNSNYVNTDGSIVRPFDVSKSAGGTTHYDLTGRHTRLNNINDSLRCFEENVVVNRGRNCPYLGQFETEFLGLYPSRDVYDTIGYWRNSIVHGNEYWQNRSPILVNLICLLIIDEIEPSLYNSHSYQIKQRIEWNTKTHTLTGIRAPWDIFPPDV